MDFKNPVIIFEDVIIFEELLYWITPAELSRVLNGSLLDGTKAIP